MFERECLRNVDRFSIQFFNKIIYIYSITSINEEAEIPLRLNKKF